MNTNRTKIAIVGRPNVGKSALFNCLVRKQQAIVDEREGVTRDRLYGCSDYFGHPLEVIDTGGMLSQEDVLSQDITRHAEIAIAEADALIFVVDYKTGPLALDFEVAKILRRTKKPIVLAVNKVDSLNDRTCNIEPFFSLGIQPMIPISCSFKWQMAELLEPLLTQMPKKTSSDCTDVPNSLPVALIGRTNVGKSTLLNQIVQEERSLVSPIAGTTRDTIDTYVPYEDGLFRFLDTAGIRRKHKEGDTVEKFARIRTERAIEESKICLLLIDCQEGVTAEEKKLARSIEDAGKGCILLLNKWDLAKGFRMEHALKSIELEIPFLATCPKVIISAKTGRNVEKIFPIIQQVALAYEQRISTHKLNKALMGWLQEYHPPMIGTKRLRIYYMTQIDACPPKFILFVNGTHLLSAGYRRYLLNKLRQTFAFDGVPLLLTLRGKDIDNKRAKKEPQLQPVSSEEDRDLAYIRSKLEEDSEEDDETPEGW